METYSTIGYAQGLHNFSLLVPEEPWRPDDYYFGTIHSAGANTVFCDAHVEYGKKKDWIKPTEAARKRWNSDRPRPSGDLENKCYSLRTE